MALSDKFYNYQWLQLHYNRLDIYAELTPALTDVRWATTCDEDDHIDDCNGDDSRQLLAPRPQFHLKQSVNVGDIPNDRWIIVYHRVLRWWRRRRRLPAEKGYKVKENVTSFCLRRMHLWEIRSKYAFWVPQFCRKYETKTKVRSHCEDIGIKSLHETVPLSLIRSENSVWRIR